MPTGPAAYQKLCDSLGIDERHRTTLFWAGLLGLPAAWWALSGRPHPAPAQDTNINAFFKQKPSAQLPAPNQSRRQPTSFQSFLKEAPQAQRDPTSFSSFLKGSLQTPSDQHRSPASQATAPAGPADTDCAITVLFGTEYGFSKEVAERAAASITASGAYWYVWLLPHSSQCLPATFACSSSSHKHAMHHMSLRPSAAPDTLDQCCCSTT